MKRTSTELPLAVVEHVFRNLISEIKKMKGKNADTTLSLCVCARFSIHCSRSVWLSAIVIMRVVKCFCCFYSLCLFFVWLCRVPGVRCRCQIRCGSTLARNRFAGTLEWMHWKFSFHLDLIRQRTRNARAAEIELPKSKSRDRRCSLAVITCYCLPSVVLGLTQQSRGIWSLCVYATMNFYRHFYVVSSLSWCAFSMQRAVGRRSSSAHIFWNVITTKHWLRKVF